MTAPSSAVSFAIRHRLLNVLDDFNREGLGALHPLDRRRDKRLLDLTARSPSGLDDVFVAGDAQHERRQRIDFSIVPASPRRLLNITVVDQDDPAPAWKNTGAK